ncbi:MAG: acylphosphatase [Desulfobacterales bacterium]|nr:acylphosphatase [Desulfobacterales bacterium]
MADIAKVHVVVSGKVQGVAYRHHTKTTALSNSISGWVKNNQDKTVEAVFEGEVENVREMINWCWEGSPSSAVDGVKVENIESEQSFDSFEIK